MSECFEYDVYLAYAKEDVEVVRELAEKLRDAGLKVGFYEWDVSLETQTPKATLTDFLRTSLKDLFRKQETQSPKFLTDRRLDQSKTILLCMSENVGDTLSRYLEMCAFHFLDPIDKRRGVASIRLDNTKVNDWMASLYSIDYQPDHRSTGFQQIVKSFEPESLHRVESYHANTDVSSKLTLMGHADRVLSVSWSPDSKKAISGSFDKKIGVWDIESGQLERLLLGHKGPVLSVSFSPGGLRAISAGSQDHTVRVWNIRSGSCERELLGHLDSVKCVAWSPNGLRAASGSHDKLIKIWNIQVGFEERSLVGHKSAVQAVAWNPDGTKLISGSLDRNLRIWDIQSGRCERTLKGHTDGVQCVAWSPDGTRAISGSDDKVIRIWDVNSGDCIGKLQGHTGWVTSISFSPDGANVISAADDNTIRVWDLESRLCVTIHEGSTEEQMSVTWAPTVAKAISGSGSGVRVWDVKTGLEKDLQGHGDIVFSASWSPDRTKIASASGDKSLRIWDVRSRKCLSHLKGHSDAVTAVAWSPDGHTVVSGSSDRTLSLWSLKVPGYLRDLNGHTGTVLAVAWSPDAFRLVSGSVDATIRVWFAESGECDKVLAGHEKGIHSIAWHPTGTKLLSGSSDKTLRIWDLVSGRCERIMEGHDGTIHGIALNREGSKAMSVASDRTLRIWDLETGKCEQIFEGHTNEIRCVAWSSDGSTAISGSDDRTVRVWDVLSGTCIQVLEGHSTLIVNVAWDNSPDRLLSVGADGEAIVWHRKSRIQVIPEKQSRIPEEDNYVYVCAKVLLVGESGAGKTGLCRRLALDLFEPNVSTVGAWATQWSLRNKDIGEVDREVWLWDFGGQADQRLIHQLYMDDTDVAVLVFDGQKENLLESLEQWDRDISRPSRKKFHKLLAMGRKDAGGLRINRSSIQTFAEDKGYRDAIETSAQTGEGCGELKEAIHTGIKWDELPARTTRKIFKRLKNEILLLREQERVLMRFSELRDALLLKTKSDFTPFTDVELRTVLSLLSGPGVVNELPFGDWVLLKPELINAYAQAVLITLQSDPMQRGCILESTITNRDLSWPNELARLSEDEERIILTAVLETCLSRGITLRQTTDKGNLFHFPSFYRQDRPDHPDPMDVISRHTFTGFLDEIYSTLTVSLHHTTAFDYGDLWRYAADFRTASGRKLCIKLTRAGPGQGDLEVRASKDVPLTDVVLLSRYVHQHLLTHATEVTRTRRYLCGKCGTPVLDEVRAANRLKTWLDGGMVGSKPPTITCQECDRRIPLWDDLEMSFASAEVKERVRQMDEEVKIELDSESKERILVGDVISTVALAGQMSREKFPHDHGIDMEIEFKRDNGEATGQKVYLQLKSGDSYLRETVRGDREIFRIKDERHGRYWMDQAFPVYLVIRSSDGVIRWMEVRDWLRKANEGREELVKQIDFEGERFDVMSVRRLRARMLGLGPGG